MALSSDLALPCRTNADSCERRRTLSCWSYWGGSIEARRTLSPQLLIRGADPGVFFGEIIHVRAEQPDVPSFLRSDQCCGSGDRAVVDVFANISLLSEIS